MKVIPALLNQSVEEFEEQVTRLSPYYQRFQVDIADGIFVPNKTKQINNLRSKIYNLTSNIDGLTFDFHLMVKDWQKEIMKLKQLAKRITIKNIFVHFSVFSLQFPYPSPSSFQTIGLVLDPSDNISDISHKYDLNKIPFVQIMSIKAGFQGQPFIPETLNKIEQLRQINYKSEIFLDGGINEKTLPIIKSQKFKPDFLCIGSYLTQEKDISNLETKIKSLDENFLREKEA